MSDLPERMASLEAWKDGHEDRCKERYDANAAALTTMSAAIVALTTKVDGAFSRVHERIDGTKVAALVAIVSIILTVLGYVVTTWGPLAK